MNKDLHTQTNALLSALQDLMKESGIWQATRPSNSAFESTMPFCCDTMSFENWLQFVFIPKMRILVSNHQALPCNILIKPMAEESFGRQDSLRAVIEAIGKIDQLLGTATKN